ncbi:uncharacterized protein [Drosophila takahashii]|uniref:uncharacterized protein n=1 Tax=Drosophila takahashii TaxID=29030 RepID=UPI001CF87C65|nr:uncharacterized protein LOC108067286 [Drosophila takahashii]
MFATYSSNDVAAHEEVDATHQEVSLVEDEMQSIIFLAHQEHEAQTHQQVMSAMKQRGEEELAKLKDINPLPKSLTRDQIDAVHDEEIRVLLDQIDSKEESSDEDDDDTF